MRTRFLALALSSFLLLLPSSPSAGMSGSGGDSKVQAKNLDNDSPPQPLAKIETIDAGRIQKSVASGLYMSGVFTYALSGGNATVTLERVNNDSFTRTTGTLRLSLWAMTYQPVRGAGISGYRLVDFATMGQLPPRTYFGSIIRGANYLRPPDGSYWLVLVLGQYDPANCPGNADGYCLEDTYISFSQVTWGLALPSFNYSDLWWSSSESGWGISILQHPSNIIFAAWFTYDDVGKPKWYVASGCQLVGDSCYGTLYETTGPPFAQTFNPAAVTVTAVGTVAFSFSSYGTALMSYNVRGVTATKSITRQPF